MHKTPTTSLGKHCDSDVAQISGLQTGTSEEKTFYVITMCSYFKIKYYILNFIYLHLFRGYKYYFISNTLQTIANNYNKF